MKYEYDTTLHEEPDGGAYVAFPCPDCGQKFRLNPKGNDKIYCYFCGKEAKKE